MAEADSQSSEEAKHGMIEIDYRPTICHLCNQFLSATYVRKYDAMDIPIYIYCSNCVKNLDENTKQYLRIT